MSNSCMESFTLNEEGIEGLEAEKHSIHFGILEKATKDMASWRSRRCALHAEALWYSKELKSSDGAAFCRWTCVPLSDCVQIVKMPNDSRVFMLQTKPRSYYWRAKTQNEAEAWLVSIASQCGELKEVELLRTAEMRIIANEVKTVNESLEFLQSLRSLEGCLTFPETRELLEGFVVEYFRAQPLGLNLQKEHDLISPAPTYTSGFGSTNPQTPKSGSLSNTPPICSTSRDKPTTVPPNLPLEDLLAFIRDATIEGARAQTLFSAHTRADPHEHQIPELGVEGILDTQNCICCWLIKAIFPAFLACPILGRRVAQLAAARNLRCWGGDINPLLAANIFDAGLHQKLLEL